MSLAAATLNKFDALLQLLPPDWEQLAFDTGAFTRSKKIKTPRELLRILFAYACGEYSLREVAGLLAQDGVEISDQAVANRLKKCGAWLEALLQGVLLARLNCPQLAGWRVKLVDGSSLQCPGATGTDFRLHVCLDALSQMCVALKVTDNKTAESLTHFTFAAGDIVLGDRADGRAKQIRWVREPGAHPVIRVSLQQLTLWTEDGQRVLWEAGLKAARADGEFTWRAFVRDAEGQRQEVYVHGHRLSEEQSAQAKRKIKQRASKKGNQTKAATWVLAEWVIVVTTLAPEEVARETILELYAVRWQVELYFKRLKSVLGLGELRAKAGSELARVQILTKMLYAGLLEKVGRRRLGWEWNEMGSERSGSWWRLWKMLHGEQVEAIIGSVEWSEWKWRLMLRGLSERKRKRKLQGVPKKLWCVLGVKVARGSSGRGVLGVLRMEAKSNEELRLAA
jgi:hypothetical protein